MPLHHISMPRYSPRICHYRGIIVLYCQLPQHGIELMARHHRRDRSKEFLLRFEAKYNAESGKDWSEDEEGCILVGQVR